MKWLDSCFHFLSYSFMNFTNSEDNKSLESFIAAFAVVKHDHVALRERENDYIVKIFLASEQSKQPVRFAFSSIFNSESQFQTPIFQREGQDPKVAYTWSVSNVSPDIPCQVFWVSYDHSTL